MEAFMMGFALLWGAFCFVFAFVNEFGINKSMDYLFLIAVFALPLWLLWFTFFGGCNGNGCDTNSQTD